MRCVAADEGHLRVQGLREDGRLRALARVGICSTTKAPDGKPWGEQRIVALVKDWVVTWRDELTLAQREVRTHVTCRSLMYKRPDERAPAARKQFDVTHAMRALHAEDWLLRSLKDLLACRTFQSTLAANA